MIKYQFRAFDIRTRSYYDGEYRTNVYPSQRMAILERISVHFRTKGMSYLIPLYIKDYNG